MNKFFKIVMEVLEDEKIAPLLVGGLAYAAMRFATVSDHKIPLANNSYSQPKKQSFNHEKVYDWLKIIITDMIRTGELPKMNFYDVVRIAKDAGATFRDWQTVYEQVNFKNKKHDRVYKKAVEHFYKRRISNGRYELE